MFGFDVGPLIGPVLFVPPIQPIEAFPETDILLFCRTGEAPFAAALKLDFWIKIDIV